MTGMVLGRTAPIDLAVQELFFTSLQLCLLYLSQYPTLVRHPSEDVCTTLCKANSIGRIWELRFSQL